MIGGSPSESLELVGGFGIDRGQAAEDVGRLLHELDARNLLEWA